MDLRAWQRKRRPQAEAPAPPAPAPAPVAPAYVPPAGYPPPATAPYAAPPPGYPTGVPIPPPGYAVVPTVTGQYGFVPLMPPAPYPAPGAVVPFAPGVVSVPPMPVVPMPGAPPTTAPGPRARTTQIVRPLSFAADPYDELLAQTPDLPTGYMGGRFHQALTPGEADARGMVRVENTKEHVAHPYGGREPTATVTSKPTGR